MLAAALLEIFTGKMVTEKEDFARAVYEIVRLVPPGRATTYGALARAAGRPGWARMAGRIMSACDSARTGIPAHRVVAAGGVLSAAGVFGEPGLMQRLLENEGVKVAGGRIRNWKAVFWDPLEQL